MSYKDNGPWFPGKYGQGGRPEHWNTRQTEGCGRQGHDSDYFDSQGKKSCRQCHLALHRRLKSERAKKLREAAIEAYGGACAECLSTDKLCIAVTDESSDLAAQARTLKNVSGFLYRHAYNNRFPKTIKLLCLRCAKFAKQTVPEDCLTGEIWRTVTDGFTNYEASNKGRVRNKNTRRVLAQRVGPLGYLQVGVKTDCGKVRDAFLHVLVVRAFEGPKPFEGAETRHLDGNKLNNDPSNLKWGTKQENLADQVRHRKEREVMPS